MANGKNARKGVFLTLDASIAMLMLFLAVLVAYAYYGNYSPSTFQSQLLRSYLHDAATVMARQGCFSAPLLSAQDSNTSCMRQALRATPASVCMQVSAYGPTVTDGMIAYWELNEESGTTVADSSQNSITGAVHGNPSFIEGGKANRAIMFRPPDYVQVGYDPRLEPESFTVSAWVLLGNQSGATQYAVDLPGGYALGFDSSGRPFFSSGSGEVLHYTGTLTEGAWHHLAGTYSAASRNMTFYFDGAQAEAVPSVDGPPYSSQALKIGSGMQGAALDDVRVYGRALLPSEVRQLYNNPFNLLYVVDKQGCPYTSGEIGSLSVPFAFNRNQEKNDYYRAVLRAWYRWGG